MAVFFIEPFYGCRILNKRNNDFAVARLFFPADDDYVAVKDSAFRHRFAVYAERKKIPRIAGIRNVFLNLLLRKNRQTGGDVTDQRDRSRRRDVVHRYGAVLVFAHSYPALCLKLLKVAVHR